MDEVKAIVEILGLDPGQVTVVGVLVVVLILVLGGLHREWYVPGKVHKEIKASLTESLTTCLASNSAAATELKDTRDDLVDYQIAYEVCVTERDNGWGHTHPSTTRPKNRPSTTRRRP